MMMLMMNVIRLQSQCIDKIAMKGKLEVGLIKGHGQGQSTYLANLAV